MKKLLVLLASLLLVGCTSTPKEVETAPNVTVEPTPKIVEELPVTTTLKVLSPTGAPALALTDFLLGSPEAITTVDGSDVLQAAFVNPTPEYDVIFAPTNLGAKLASAGKTEYRLAAVVTWGNLYLLGSDEADLHNPEKKLAAFGETAVPGLVFNSVLEQMDIQASITWYPSVSDAQTALLSGEADVALIAEPAATATIAKAKQNEISLSVLADIQSAWMEKTGFEGYPQAAIFVNQASYIDKQGDVDAFLSQIETTLAFQNDSNNAEVLVANVDAIGTDVLGTPAGAVVSKAYAGMNLTYREATDVRDELQAFLELFGINEIDSIFLTQK